MFFLKSAYCRVFQGVFRLALPLLPYREPEIVDSYGEAAYQKLHALSVAAGVCAAGQSHKEAAESFISAIRELNRKMGIPEKLGGIQAADIPIMAAHAEKEANPLYPVPKLMTAKELEGFYYKIADWS